MSELTNSNFIEKIFSTTEWPQVDFLRRSLDTPTKNKLFELVSEYLVEQKTAKTANNDFEERSRKNAGEAPLRIGDRIHINLSDLIENDLANLRTLCALLLSYVSYDVTAAASAMVERAIGVTTLLNLQNGETCTVSACAEITHDRGEPSCDSITEKLSSRDCRHIGKACQFESNGKCTITLENVKQTIKTLTDRKVLESKNNAVRITM